MAVLALVATAVAVLASGFRHAAVSAGCDQPSAMSVVVRDGDSLQSIARTYFGSESCATVIAQQNNLSASEPLPAGASLSLAPLVSATAQASARYTYGISGGPTPSAPGPVSVLFPTISISGLIWPLTGPLTQPFGVPELGVGTPHTGIDIGQATGTPVRAAQAGRVIFSGGDPCCGLGYWAEINHGNRYSTRYGHFMRPPIVLPGDYVQQGQIIGFSGDTGFSTGPHLHFEVRLDGVPVDPLRLLPFR